MTAVPSLLATAAREETAGGVTYHIAGELVPVLQVELGTLPVYFEHYILLWKDPAVQIGLKPLRGAVRRVLSGMPVLVTQAQGPGRIAFSRDGAGHVFAMHMGRENRSTSASTNSSRRRIRWTIRSAG